MNKNYLINCNDLTESEEIHPPVPAVTPTKPVEDILSLISKLVRVPSVIESYPNEKVLAISS